MATKTVSKSQARPKSGSKSDRRKAADSAAPMDAIKLLKADHREVKTLFADFEQASDKADKQAIADKICAALTVHAQIEEDMFYPAAYAALDDDDLLDEAEVEHTSAKELISQIQASAAGEPLFDARVTVLGEYINHHVEEEEGELFPECRASGMDLKALGQQMADRKAELMGEKR